MPITRMMKLFLFLVQLSILHQQYFVSGEQYNPTHFGHNFLNHGHDTSPVKVNFEGPKPSSGTPEARKVNIPVNIFKEGTQDKNSSQYQSRTQDFRTQSHQVFHPVELLPPHVQPHENTVHQIRTSAEEPAVKGGNTEEHTKEEHTTEETTEEHTTEEATEEPTTEETTTPIKGGQNVQHFKLKINLPDNNQPEEEEEEGEKSSVDLPTDQNHKLKIAIHHQKPEDNNEPQKFNNVAKNVQKDKNEDSESQLTSAPSRTMTTTTTKLPAIKKIFHNLKNFLSGKKENKERPKASAELSQAKEESKVRKQIVDTKGSNPLKLVIIEGPVTIVSNNGAITPEMPNLFLLFCVVLFNTCLRLIG